MQGICVFCGSSPGAQSEYTQAAKQLGRVLAERKLGLIYGGSNVGMMGEVANAALQKGGEVIGVIPEKLAQKGVAHPNLSKLHIVGSMHERKALMADLADAFIALPGGLGTIEEFFEVLTWAQLGIHRKPCGLLDVCQYYSKLLDFLDHTVSQRFVKKEHRSMILVAEAPEILLQQLQEYQVPQVDKWIDRS
jgi:uncharacterized protein (TIGR00730 family)